MKRFLSLFVTMILLLMVGAVFTVSADEMVLKLSGITVKDEHPNGCVDCHKVSGGNDYRLNVELGSGHPDISKIVRTVPNDCSMCHKANTKAGALNLQTHKIHYQNPANNNFVKAYQGDCLTCHSLDLATGVMKVKSGPKNW